MEELQRFLQTVNQNGILWLLEAKPGLFAMLEDGNGNSYIPVWATKEEAEAKRKAGKGLFAGKLEEESAKLNGREIEYYASGYTKAAMPFRTEVKMKQYS